MRIAVALGVTVNPTGGHTTTFLGGRWAESAPTLAALVVHEAPPSKRKAATNDGLGILFDLRDYTTICQVLATYALHEPEVRSSRPEPLPLDLNTYLLACSRDGAELVVLLLSLCEHLDSGFGAIG